jgi:hypothetical protein
VCRFQAPADKWKPSVEEGDAEEERGEGENLDRRPETEEQVPNSRSSEEGRANDARLEICLSARTGERYDLISGRAQRLESG